MEDPFAARRSPLGKGDRLRNLENGRTETSAPLSNKKVLFEFLSKTCNRHEVRLFPCIAVTWSRSRFLKNYRVVGRNEHVDHTASDNSSKYQKTVEGGYTGQDGYNVVVDENTVVEDGDTAVADGDIVVCPKGEQKG